MDERAASRLAVVRLRRLLERAYGFPMQQVPRETLPPQIQEVRFLLRDIEQEVEALERAATISSSPAMQTRGCAA
jgi:hypothetical protein